MLNRINSGIAVFAADAAVPRFWHRPFGVAFFPGSPLFPVSHRGGGSAVFPAGVFADGPLRRHVYLSAQPPGTAPGQFAGCLSGCHRLGNDPGKMPPSVVFRILEGNRPLYRVFVLSHGNYFEKNRKIIYDSDAY